MTDRALERGREVYLVSPEGQKVRVSLQASWGLPPGSRLANSTRWFETRTQTVSTATSSVGMVGSVVLSVVWLVVVSARWIAYQCRRRRDWTVSLSAYDTMPVTLAARREPVDDRSVRTLQHSRHPDYEAALQAAKLCASELQGQGYRPMAYPVGWNSR